VLGSSGSGKSALLSAFLQRPFSQTYHPTIKPRSAVNSVELGGGKQCYLILEELGELEPAILENQAKLDACDLVCYTYDSSDPDSFAHIVELRKKYPHLDDLPAVYTALKADQDKTMQRCEVQPDEYTSALNMAAPLHVSTTWSSISELFVHVSAYRAHKKTQLLTSTARGVCYIPLDGLPQAGGRASGQYESLPGAGGGCVRGGVGGVYLEAQHVCVVLGAVSTN
jgi:Ras family protein T1